MYLYQVEVYLYRRWRVVGSYVDSIVKSMRHFQQLEDDDEHVRIVRYDEAGVPWVLIENELIEKVDWIKEGF